METEIWKDIPGFDGRYQASNFGKIKSYRIKISRPNTRDKNYIQTRWYGKGGLLNQNFISQGGKFTYYYLTLTKNKISKKYLVHRLILLTFVGDCPEGMVACHNDGNGHNNRLENLRWDTASANQKDRAKHGTDNFPVMKGIDHPLCRLTEENIYEIRNTRKYKGYRIYLSKKFNITVSNVSEIVKRRTWKHL